jgi:putative ABC transport system permease protein
VLPEPVGPDAWLGPAAVAVIPVALAALLTGSNSIREPRKDLTSGSPGTGRWIVEVAAVALAAIAVLLLQRRGLTASSAVVGIDPLLSATPLLLAAVVGLLVVRVYPIPLRAIDRALGSKRAATASVGAARAIREPAIGLIGTVGLVTGIAIVLFTVVMMTTVSAGLQQAARDEVGADLQVRAQNLPDSLVADIVELSDVRAAVALVSGSGVAFSDEVGSSEVTVVLADTAALHEVRPDIPDLTGKVDGRLRILLSADLADDVIGTELRILDSRALAEGELETHALPGAPTNWILVDIAAQEELGLAGQVPARILAALEDGADSGEAVDAVTRVVVASQSPDFESAVRVDDAVSLLAEARMAPITSGLERSLVVVAAGSLALTMLIVALSSITAAASRNRAVGVLRILGMTRRQIRSIVAWEFTPVAITAITVGAALGLALPYLITSVLDLQDFVGGQVAPQPVIEPASIGIAIAVFVVAVGLATAIATASGRRLAPAGVLKMGEE